MAHQRGDFLLQCIDRRIPDRATLEREIAAWERQRNHYGEKINWMFTTEQARAKLAKAYPQNAKES